MKVVVNGWTLDTATTQKAPAICVNVNAAMGPAPGGYVAVPGFFECYLTGDELRRLWDAWAEWHGMSERPA